MKYTLKNKELELTDEEEKEIVKQNTTPVEEKKVGIAIKNRWTGEIIFQSSKTTYREALIEKSNANLSEANLRGANMRDANLSDADLSGANLSDANLSDANLSDANLRGANLSYADLRGADLQNAKFYGKGGTRPLKRSQLPAFLGALGFIIED
jgi:hypothetical protein